MCMSLADWLHERSKKDSIDERMNTDCCRKGSQRPRGAGFGGGVLLQVERTGWAFHRLVDDFCIAWSN